MIVTKAIELTLGAKNFTHLKKKYKLNDNLKAGDKFTIQTEMLSNGSHIDIDVKCDYCGKELKVPYKRYKLSTKVIDKYACSGKECSNQKIKDVCLIKYGVENPFQSEDVKDKTKKTLIIKYGVEHPMLSESIKDKLKETCLERYGYDNYRKTNEYVEKFSKTCLDRYGVEYPSQTEAFQIKNKNTRILNGSQIPDNLVSEFRKYRLAVLRVTNKVKKSIIDNWDGMDYYDNETIRDNFKLNPNDRNFPHLDHKISIVYGFKNGLDPKEVGKSDNICITKQWINGLKRGKCAEEFKLEFKAQKTQ